MTSGVDERGEREGGKVAWGECFSPPIEAGVHLPHPQLMAWIDDFMEERAAFPNARMTTSSKR